MAALAAVLTASCSPAGRELVQVDFQEFFNSDTVSLSIEGQTVMPAQVLTSDATGKACRTVRLCATDDCVDVCADECRIEFPCRPRRLYETSVTLNGTVRTYLIDPEKGRYIGFGKSRGALCMVQSRSPFDYD